MVPWHILDKLLGSTLTLFMAINGSLLLNGLLIFQMNSPVFLYWKRMKETVYKAPVEDELVLVVRIVAAAAEIQDNPSVFQNVRESMHKRCSVTRLKDRSFSNYCRQQVTSVIERTTLQQKAV